MKTNKGFIGIGLLIAILAVLAVGGGAVYYAKKISTPVSKNTPIKIPDDSSKNVSQDTNGYQKAKVVNLTGLDGCGYLIELENGQRLEPTNLSNEFKKDKLSVLIKYKETPINSVCMAGKGVELTDIILNSLPTPTSYTLIVNQGGTGQGNVTSSPSRINCGYNNNSGPNCSQAFPVGSTVTLNAVASSGSYFAGWGQDCNGSNASFTLIMNGYKQCAPTFNLTAQSSRLTSFAGSNWEFNAQSYGLTSIKVYYYPTGTEVTQPILFEGMILGNTDSNGLQSWRLSAAIPEGGNRPPSKIMATSIYAVGYVGTQQKNRIDYPYTGASDIDSHLY